MRNNMTSLGQFVPNQKKNTQFAKKQRDFEFKLASHNFEENSKASNRTEPKNLVAGLMNKLLN